MKEEWRGTRRLKKARIGPQISSKNLVDKFWTTVTFDTVLKFSN